MKQAKCTGNSRTARDSMGAKKIEPIGGQKEKEKEKEKS